METTALYLLAVSEIQSMPYANGWLKDLWIQPTTKIPCFPIPTNQLLVTENKESTTLKITAPLRIGLVRCIQKYQRVIWAWEVDGFLKVAGLVSEGFWEHTVAENKQELLTLKCQSANILWSDKSLFNSKQPRKPLINPDNLVFSAVFADDFSVSGTDVTGIMAVSWEGVPLVLGYQDNFELQVYLPSGLPKKRGALVLHTTTESIVSEVFITIE